MSALRPLFLLGAVLAAAPAFAQQLGTACSGKAATLIEALARKDFKAASADFDAAMQSGLPPDKLRSVWSSIEAAAGSYQGSDAATSAPAPAPGATLVTVPLRFARLGLDALVACNTQGAVSGFHLVPRAAAPAAASTETSTDYEASDVRIPAGSIELQAIYRQPRKGTAPFPLVILVGGSGPTDRDGTAGTFKPLRDIAQGLARQGVATLAYDKRTHSHPQQPVATIDDEYVDDAVAVVAFAEKNPDVDKARIYFLGHSQGGSIAPRVAVRSSAVAGLILLAPSLEPLETAIGRQMHYLAEKDGKVDEAERTQLDQIDAELENLKQLQRGETPQGRLPLGVPASYWQSLWAYDVLETARSAGKPVIALFGDKDYQVLAEPTATALRQGLDGKLPLQIERYKRLGHLFVRDGADHVDSAVIDAIVAWIQTANVQGGAQ